VAVELLRKIQQQPLPNDTLLNVNVPDLPLSELKGMQITRLGQRHKAEPVIKSADPRGNPIYWVGPPGAEQDAGPGTDFDAIKNGYVSITPLQLDLTRFERIQSLSDWLNLEAGS
jgi:5'-nucleotidase